MPDDKDSTDQSHERKLAAILAADVAGYSKLMADDELATVKALKDARGTFRERIGAHGGRLIDTAGDSVLAEFKSVVEAVQCAVEVQERLGAANEPVPEHRKMHFRIGINLGDIIEEDDGTIYGDGVNVAARLESLAVPGGVMVSDFARQAVEGKLDVGLEDAGAHDVKNIAKPVRAWRVLADGSGSVTPDQDQPTPRVLHRPKVIAGLVASLAVVIGLAVWGVTVRVEVPQMVTADGTPTDNPVLAIPTGPSIAVLPFDDMSGEPGQDYFADGLAEDILTRLSRFSSLRVLGRNTSFQFKGKALDSKVIGERLGADYVLEGSVRRSPENIRVTAQLLDSSDGANVWAESYDYPLTASDLFKLQDEITDRVTTALGSAHGAIAGSGIKAIQAKPPDQLRSYECVLKAQEYVRVTTPEAHLAARTCLLEVLEDEPNYVDALAWLGQMYVEELWSGFNARDDGPAPLEAAFDVLNRAIQLDPEHQLARKVMALAYYFGGNGEQFLIEGRKAVEINVNDTNTLVEMAMFLSYVGRWDEGATLIQRLKHLQSKLPSWHFYTEFNHHYRNGEFEFAAEAARKTLEIPHWGGPFYLAIANAALGNKKLTSDALQQVREINPNISEEEIREVLNWLFIDKAHFALLMDAYHQAIALAEPEAPARPVIAVLPFANMSGDAEQEYFADGITEDIITRLAQFPDFGVIARNSSFQYKGENVDIRAVANELGATYVLEGSVRRSESDIRVTAQLLDATDGTHLWAETYDRDLSAGSIFDIQDNVTEHVVGIIAGVHGVIARSAAVAARARPENLDSYDCVLLAYAYDRIQTAEAFLASKACLEGVLIREPDYVDGLSALAYIAADGYGMGWGISEDERPRLLQDALSAGQRAVALSPDDPKSHWSLAYAEFVAGDVSSFHAHAERALALNPNDASVKGLAGVLMTFSGDYERGLRLIEEAISLNPHYPEWWQFGVAGAHLMADRVEAMLESILKIDQPDNYWTHYWRVVAFASNDKMSEARQSVADLLTVYPGYTITKFREECRVYWNCQPDYIEKGAVQLARAGLPES